MIHGIKNFIVWLFLPLTRYFGKAYSVEFLEDPVDNPRHNILYIVGTKEMPWQVEILCPCGCKDKIVLPVNEGTSPRWAIEITKEGIPSISPSIWRSKGCKSHFFLRSGLIKWCQ